VEDFPQQTFSEAGYQADYQRILRTSKWKLIYVPAEADRKIMRGSPFELYDIANDPAELTNVIDSEPRVAGELKGDLLEWIRRAGSGTEQRSEHIRVDEKTTESLKALGYVE